MPSEGPTTNKLVLAQTHSPLVCVSCRYTFASGSADNIKQWMFPDGNFIQNLSGHNAIINTLAVNSDGVLVSGGIHASNSHLVQPLTARALPHMLCLSSLLCLSPSSRQRHHPHVGLEDGLQLPAHPRGGAARLPGQRVGHLRLPLRPLREPTDHRRGRQDHQGLQRGRLGRKFSR